MWLLSGLSRSSRGSGRGSWNMTDAHAGASHCLGAEWSGSEVSRATGWSLLRGSRYRSMGAIMIEPSARRQLVFRGPADEPWQRLGLAAGKAQVPQRADREVQVISRISVSRCRAEQAPARAGRRRRSPLVQEDPRPSAQAAPRPRSRNGPAGRGSVTPRCRTVRTRRRRRPGDRIASASAVARAIGHRVRPLRLQRCHARHRAHAPPPGSAETRRAARPRAAPTRASSGRASRPEHAVEWSNSASGRVMHTRLDLRRCRVTGVPCAKTA